MIFGKKRNNILLRLVSLLGIVITTIYIAFRVFPFQSVELSQRHLQAIKLEFFHFTYDHLVNPFALPKAAFIGTTGADIPLLFKTFLLKYSPIDTSLTDKLPAAASVENLEKEVGWNSIDSIFLNLSVIEPLIRNGIGGGNAYSNVKRYWNVVTNYTQNRPLSDIVDIVVPSIRDLDFLEIWKPFIENLHIIIIQDGDPKVTLKIPDWADFELYNRLDIEKALGRNAWIISSKDASIRNFGFLVSDKDIIYTIDDDCLPAKHPITGQAVNAIEEHVANLLSPSTPFFFNTIYDPYRPGADFVRGYPYSLRNGVPTAISHGLWMNAYDYDAPTQLLKVTERNERYSDVTLTIPYGVYYPMCSMNVAFNKNLIGVAFMQGLMGEGQPWARYDDMFAGWASKVVVDHLGLGVKSGAPYIHHNKASNPFTNLKKEYMGLFWQEEIIAFMMKVKLSPTSKTAATAYDELADKVISELSYLNPYFVRLGKAMKTWVDVWELRFGGNYGQINCNGYAPHHAELPQCVVRMLPTASKSNIAPSNQSTCAIFTITHNEQAMLPLWFKYYSKIVPLKDIWILDHNTNDGSTDASKFPEGTQIIRLYGDNGYMPHVFINRHVDMHQHRLLRAGYKCVLFTETDEFIVPDPDVYKRGLLEYFQTFINNPNAYTTRVLGYHIVHISNGAINVEPAIDLSKPILGQRNYWQYDDLFNKPLLTKVPLRYTPGHHSSAGKSGKVSADKSLFMIHLHNIDKEMCLKRELRKHESSKMTGKVDENGWGMNAYSSKPFDEVKLYDNVCGRTLSSIRVDGTAVTASGSGVSKIPERFKSILI